MELPVWLSELLATYVVPYWPWIVGAILGLVLLRYALRKMINRAVGLAAGVLLFGGSFTAGGATWLSDRGLGLPDLSFF